MACKPDDFMYLGLGSRYHGVSPYGTCGMLEIEDLS